MQELDPAQVVDKLKQLAALDRKHKLFGATGHRYALFPRLPEKAVRAIEKKWRVALPDAYRRFLLEIGNGGAGPSYGLFKLGEEGDSATDAKRFKRGPLVGDVSRPWRHKKSWNLPRSVWRGRPGNGMSVADEERAWAAWDRARAEDYGSSVMAGAIPICHLGCTYRQWLVVSGPRAGEIWNDNRTDEAGLSPVTSGRRHVGFAEWYEQWLSASLRQVKRGRA